MTVFRSISDMSKIISKNISRFADFNADLIVGIPRSGMLPANFLSLYLNKPMTDLDSFLENHIYKTGQRGKEINQNIKNILVVDDSVSSGVALKEAKIKLKEKELKYKIFYATIYTRSLMTNQTDIYCEIIDDHRVFEWNLFHHWILNQSCVDIDGVLCEDPVIDDDDEKYREFLLTAKPKFIPTVKIKTLISCRLEKYRNITEWWLKKHNIQYNRLIMLNLPDKAARLAWGKHGDYKAEEYNKPEYKFFVESSLKEAKRIKELTGKPVFCVETFTLV